MTSRHPRVHGIHSRVIGQVELDDAQLTPDIETLLQFPFDRG
jgi:hypothetical protein